MTTVLFPYDYLLTLPDFDISNTLTSQDKHNHLWEYYDNNTQRLALSLIQQANNLLEYRKMPLDEKINLSFLCDLLKISVIPSIKNKRLYLSTLENFKDYKAILQNFYSNKSYDKRQFPTHVSENIDPIVVKPETKEEKREWVRIHNLVWDQLSVERNNSVTKYSIYDNNSGNLMAIFGLTPPSLIVQIYPGGLLKKLKEREGKNIQRLPKDVKERSEFIKHRHIASCRVCGAIPPYNKYLLGKLACLLSIDPDFAHDPYLYSTTSLFGSHSSQYNRISLPSEFFEDNVPHKLLNLGEIGGSSTSILSHRTFDLINLENNSIKKGIQRIDQSTSLGWINNLSITPKRGAYYFYELSNFEEYIFEGAEPISIWKQEEKQDRIDRIIGFWRNRWFNKRLEWLHSNENQVD